MIYSDTIDLNGDNAENLGKAIINLFSLRQNEDCRYDTSWGDKTKLGIGRTVLRLVNEANHKEMKEAQKTPDGISCEDHITKKYGSKATELIQSLIRGK